MMKLIRKMILFLGISLAMVFVLEYLSINDETKEYIAVLTNSLDYSGDENGTADIVTIIKSAKTADDTNVLVIGDSIARQMFADLQGDGSEVQIDCANAAINISGQYMLAVTWLDSHPGATDVWMFAHPLTLDRGYDLQLGYAYAVMPFAIEGVLNELDDVTLDQMASVYGRFALNSKVATIINGSPMNRKLFFSYIRMFNEEYVQANAYEIASLYILKLKDLCEERGVSFHFYSSPSTEYYREKIEDTRSDYEKSSLYEVYPDYLNSIYYFPTEWSNDSTHFGGEYASRETYDMVINEAYDEFFAEL